MIWDSAAFWNLKSNSAIKETKPTVTDCTVRSKLSLVTQETAVSTARPLQVNVELFFFWTHMSNQMIQWQVALSQVFIMSYNKLRVSCYSTVVVCTSMWTSAHCAPTHLLFISLRSLPKSRTLQVERSSSQKHISATSVLYPGKKKNNLINLIPLKLGPFAKHRKGDCTSGRSQGWARSWKKTARPLPLRWSPAAKLESWV